ncbi:hypothetical protein AVEN_251484-1 [Araneus ventricosus]|uniref:Uncharacterized protein n=1 Tax=Araneus ventricosus TaxID=182803 RepID=A0A4Y2K4R7_ARAVE|nr:hypothetical protein AVEN_251484-1 [Araneus ventricosus]
MKYTERKYCNLQKKFELEILTNLHLESIRESSGETTPAGFNLLNDAARSISKHQGLASFRHSLEGFLQSIRPRWNHQLLSLGLAWRISKSVTVATTGKSSSMDIHSSYSSFCIPSGGSMTITDGHFPAR